MDKDEINQNVKNVPSYPGLPYIFQATFLNNSNLFQVLKQAKLKQTNEINGYTS